MGDAPDPLVGQTIQDRYRVLSLIGRGGMGSVYEVEHLAFGGRFALKTLHAKLTLDKDARRRFKLEARAAAATGHKHIVQVTDMGELDDGTPFIVLELLRGRSLAQEIGAVGRLGVARSVSIALQCCAALAATHERGIVHRDLKPENIYLLAGYEPADFVKVLDFGVSKFVTGHAELGISRRTTEGTQIGTPVFMSPEQLAGAADVGPAADQFSLGVVLYEMLTGQLPFEARGFAALVVAITTAPARPPSEIAPEVPPELEAIVLRTLEKHPDARFGSMAELAAALLPMHRSTHADTSGGWSAVIDPQVTLIAAAPALTPEPGASAPVPEATTAAVAEATTVPRRKPVKISDDPPAVNGAIDRPRALEMTGPLRGRDSSDGRAIASDPMRESEILRAASSSPWKIVLVASLAAIALVGSAVLVTTSNPDTAERRSVASERPAQPAGERTPASSDDERRRRETPPAASPTEPATITDAATAHVETVAPSGQREDVDAARADLPVQPSKRTELPRRAGRDAGHRRPGSERETTPGATEPAPSARSVAVRSQWDAAVSLRLVCGAQRIEATIPAFGTRSVRLPPVDCLVTCSSAVGLPRCPLRLGASASTLAIRR